MNNGDDSEQDIFDSTRVGDRGDEGDEEMEIYEEELASSSPTSETEEASRLNLTLTERNYLNGLSDRS